MGPSPDSGARAEGHRIVNGRRPTRDPCSRPSSSERAAVLHRSSVPDAEATSELFDAIPLRSCFSKLRLEPAVRAVHARGKIATLGETRVTLRALVPPLCGIRCRRRE